MGKIFLLPPQVSSGCPTHPNIYTHVIQKMMSYAHSQIVYNMRILFPTEIALHNGHLALYRVGLWQDAVLQELLQCFFFLSTILFSGCVSIRLLLWGKDYDRSIQFLIEQTQHIMKLSPWHHGIGAFIIFPSKSMPQFSSLVGNAPFCRFKPSFITFEISESLKALVFVHYSTSCSLRTLSSQSGTCGVWIHHANDDLFAASHKRGKKIVESVKQFAIYRNAVTRGR